MEKTTDNQIVAVGSSGGVGTTTIAESLTAFKLETQDEGLYQTNNDYSTNTVLLIGKGTIESAEKVHQQCGELLAQDIKPIVVVTPTGWGNQLYGRNTQKEYDHVANLVTVIAMPHIWQWIDQPKSNNPKWAQAISQLKNLIEKEQQK